MHCDRRHDAARPRMIDRATHSRQNVAGFGEVVAPLPLEFGASVISGRPRSASRSRRRGDLLVAEPLRATGRAGCFYPIQPAGPWPGTAKDTIVPEEIRPFRRHDLANILRTDAHNHGCQRQRELARSHHVLASAPSDAIWRRNRLLQPTVPNPRSTPCFRRN